MPGLFRVRGYADGTRTSFPTPMISFDNVGFAALADAVFAAHGSKEPVMARTLDPAYRRIQADLHNPSADAGVPAGAFHDLQASFDRVNAEYFAGAMLCPRLTWSRQITSCKFGHYDPLRDELMVSATLDSRDVPTYVVDFVVYHELLHKKHGVSWRNGRQAVHTPALRKDERRFAEYQAAEAAIRKIAKRMAT